VAVTVTNLIFWVALGGIVALVRPRFAGSADGLRNSFA
jgi:predicted cobalt transporter CbtA